MLTTDELKLVMDHAYRAIIEEIHDRQKRIVLYNVGLLADGLAQQEFMRHVSRHESWKRRKERTDREYKNDTNRLAILIPLVEKLEAMFAEYHDKDDAEWSTAVADYIKTQRQSRSNN